MTKFKFFILGIKRDFRGADLYNLLRNVGVDVEIIFGADARFDLPFDHKTSVVKSDFYYGRQLALGEHACAYGHSLIIMKALKSDCDLAIVLEDDVIITEVTKFIELIRSLDVTKKALFTFYQDDKSILNCNLKKNRNIIFRNYCIPVGTVAYAITKPAMNAIGQKIINSDWVGFQADYPLFYADKLFFYVVRNAVLNLGDSESLIGNRGKSVDLQTSRLVRIFRVYSCFNWLNYGHLHSSLRAYLMFFHGRKVAKYIFNLRKPRLKEV